MGKPEGHYSLFRVPFQIDADGDCTRCGLKIEPDEETMELHECPPGFMQPSMSGSKGQALRIVVQQIVSTIDGLAYIDPNDHRKCEDAVIGILSGDAALRAAKAEGLREGAVIADRYGANEWSKEVQDTAARISLRIEARIAELEREGSK